MIKFSDEKLKKATEIIARYPEGRQKSALIPLLHMAQDEFGGWLSPEAMDYVASLLKLEPIEVYEVATFYSMYNMKPVGRFQFEVCQTGPCMLNGSDQIIDYIKEKLNIGVGETTTDGLFSLKDGGMSGRLRLCADDAARKILSRTPDKRESRRDHRGVQAKRGEE